MISTNLRIQRIKQENPASIRKPSPAEEFLIRHNYPYVAEEKICIVQSAIKISEADSEIDFSKIYAPQAVYYSSGFIDLDKMPYTEPNGLRVKDYRKIRYLGKQDVYNAALKRGICKNCCRVVADANSKGLKNCLACLSSFFHF